MNTPIRKLAAVVAIMFVALMGAATWVQFFQAASLNADNRNVRTLYRDYGTYRGPIVVDGTAVVYSTPVNDPFNYQRTYVDGPLYAHAGGFYSIAYGLSGIEKSQDALLSGEADSLFWSRLTDLLAGRDQEGGAVELTIRGGVQSAAAEALGDQVGAVVALDPRTGEVLAMYSSPSYDPAVLAAHNTAAVSESYRSLADDPVSPLINRAIGGDTYPPGSIFKLVVAAAALEAGATPQTVVNAPTELELPQSTSTLGNYGGDPCVEEGDTTTLADALRTSCNTAFADLGMNLGWDAIAREAAEFGWGATIEVPLRVTPSQLPEDPDDAQVALSSIGQYDVKATPLQVAMVGAAIANEGTLMKPYLVASTRGPDLRIIDLAEPSVYSQPLTVEDAAALRDMMVLAVEDGTGRNAQIADVSVAGKTGTAQTGVEGEEDHAWFVGFAPADNPTVVVAVVVENGGTGGSVAAPIAKSVLEAGLAAEEERVAKDGAQ